MIRRELARLDLDDGTEVSVVDDANDDEYEFIVVHAGGEAQDRLEQITEESEEEDATTAKPVLTFSNKEKEVEHVVDRINTDCLDYLEGISRLFCLEEENDDDEQFDTVLANSVNDLSKALESKIEEVLGKLEKINSSISDREKSLKLLNAKHEKERDNLEHKHIQETSETYTEFRKEIQQMSERHEKMMEEFQNVNGAAQLWLMHHR